MEILIKRIIFEQTVIEEVNQPSTLYLKLNRPPKITKDNTIKLIIDMTRLIFFPFKKYYSSIWVFGTAFYRFSCVRPFNQIGYKLAVNFCEVIKVPNRSIVHIQNIAIIFVFLIFLKNCVFQITSS